MRAALEGMRLNGLHFTPCHRSDHADLTIRASAQDFLQLAQRQVDPDTLFFSRRLVMEGDTELLELVGLQGKENTYPGRLSGGQKQRVGIARALVHHPEILLCDEATSALDPETTQSILALLRDINRQLGLTVVLITHEMGVIREICDQVLVLEKGRIAETGPVWQVFGEPRHDATRALLRDASTRTLNEQLDAERDTQSALGKTHDYIEGVTAFLEKRPAQFKGA